jgi:16S rRNA (cytidine1402-2'-O)-methyltransferase
LYEAANRLAGTLGDLARACGGARRCSVSRELTKRFEQSQRGTLEEFAEYYSANPVRGEVVIVMEGSHVASTSGADWGALASSLAGRGLSTRDIVSVMVQEHGAPRNLAYKLARKT